MTTRVSYKSIDLKAPAKIFLGRGRVTSVEAVEGMRISRVFDGPLDYFIVEGGTAVPGYEIESSNVAGGIRADLPSLKGKGGKAKATDGEE